MERGQELREDGGPTVASDLEGEMERGQELREDGGSFFSPGSSHLPQEDLDEPPSSVSLACPRVRRVSMPGPWRGGSVRSGTCPFPLCLRRQGLVAAVAGPGLEA